MLCCCCCGVGGGSGGGDSVTKLLANRKNGDIFIDTRVAYFRKNGRMVGTDRGNRDN